MIEPLIVEIDTKRSAYEIFSIFNHEEEVVFFDSSLEDERLGQYSFLAFNPFLTFRYKDGEVIINNNAFQGDIFEELNKITNEYQVVNKSGLPFIGGGMGYFSYDLVRDLEKIPNLSQETLNIPTCYFNFYDTVIIYDHKQGKVFASALGIKEVKEKSITYIIHKIMTDLVNTPFEKGLSKEIAFHSKFTKESYIDTVEKVRQYIKNGDVYITNLTHTFTTDIDEAPLTIYKKLRTINPAPFSAIMQLDGFNILSSSPERFLKITNGHVETRPIKGTRPRGKTIEEDERNKEALLNSEKDKSELLMIVDLERNDLSKVCRPYTVKVEGLFELEAYATVYHLAATIKGQLKDSCTAVDCIKACFPGGSITGTPKIRSMQIIEELEPTRRNIYTGCIGYLGFDGNADMNIVIRTIVEKDGQVFIGVGGGVTWESDCLEEYQETLDKASALFASITQKI